MRRPTLAALLLTPVLAAGIATGPAALAANRADSGAAVAAASPAAATSATATARPSVAANRVGPGQAFTGRVNGSFSDATVLVFCPGPIRVGQRGHPLAGQPLDVLSPLPPVAAGTKVSVGLTGTRARTIQARFAGVPSVAAEGPLAATFTQYFVNKNIPTSLLLPCYGTGEVVFRPTPTSPGARSSVVSVRYVNPAV
jgi:hypothetical protein